MPGVDMSSGETNAFTIINHEDEGAQRMAPFRNVNVVKPLQHEPEMTAGSQTILDPKFSRALDFKLRRLKEKEILRANLRRPTRGRRLDGLISASNPNVSLVDRTTPCRAISRSHPRIDVVASEVERAKLFPKMQKPPPKNRTRKVSGLNEGDKPRFVTTVKSGQFLLPPPEVACLLGLETLYPTGEREKIVYSYASKPKAVAGQAKRSMTEKKQCIPNGNICNDGRKPHVGELFRGVRSLVGGVAGISRLLEQRDQPGSMAAGYSNVMHDKRVVRGSTFASHPHAAGDGAESAAARAARTRRRALARRAALARLRPASPPPAPGRRHLPVQTEYYLEELFEKGVEMSVGVQTDLFADRPATPIYVPAKTGADAATQIYPGELFDFELEVQPILEVLVGKTAEQALSEVAQEEELCALREQQRRYRELRAAELSERQRLAAQETRLHTEKERRVAEARLARTAALEARGRVACAALVQGYVAELLPAALAGLRDARYLQRRLLAGVEEEAMPWLISEVSHELEAIITSRDVITEIVRDVIEARNELYRGAGETEPCASPPDSESASDHESEEEHEVIACTMWPDGAACGCGVVARRGLARGAATQEFSLAELAAAIDDPPTHNVYVEPDDAGGLWARGGAARVAVRARLAPATQQRSLELTEHGGMLRLRLADEVPPLHELLLWPDTALLAALAMPHLTLLNITGTKSYTCHKCRTEFEHPNPLKVHLLLGCRQYTALDFWRHCLARLQSASPAASGALQAAPWASPADLEALAAAWGRSRDGHVCVYCGKLYSRKYGLKIHIRTHTGYKPLRCRHCLRAFGDPSNLNKHVRLHAASTTSAAHACGVCGAALMRRRDLERHIRARHPALLACTDSSDTTATTTTTTVSGRP